MGTAGGLYGDYLGTMWEPVIVRDLPLTGLSSIDEASAPSGDYMGTGSDTAWRPVGDRTDP